MKILNNDMYLLLIDEKAEIKGSPFLCYNPLKITWDDDVVLYQGAMPEYNYRGLQKIIAYYPLNSEAKELDLPLLPNPFEVDIEKLACKKYNIKEGINDYDERYYNSHNVAKAEAFITGYKAAQAKQFSLEDIKKAFNAGYDLNTWEQLGVPNEERDYLNEHQFIQSLSTQQLPKEFYPEIAYHNLSIYDKLNGKPYLKTITNSEGKEVLVGTYKFVT